MSDFSVKMVRHRFIQQIFYVATDTNNQNNVLYLTFQQEYWPQNFLDNIVIYFKT
jgi:hypothetical protein